MDWYVRCTCKLGSALPASGSIYVVRSFFLECPELVNVDSGSVGYRLQSGMCTVLTVLELRERRGRGAFCAYRSLVNFMSQELERATYRL